MLVCGINTVQRTARHSQESVYKLLTHANILLNFYALVGTGAVQHRMALVRESFLGRFAQKRFKKHKGTRDIFVPCGFEHYPVENLS